MSAMGRSRSRQLWVESGHLPGPLRSGYHRWVPFRRPIALALLLLAGCDRLYGVQSRATFTDSVDIACVGSTLASVPGVGTVTYGRSEDRSTEIIPKQRKVLTVMHVWLYGERGVSALQMNQTPDGWEFTNARLRMGIPVPPAEIARFVPLMRLVNETLANRCGLPVADLQPQPL